MSRLTKRRWRYAGCVVGGLIVVAVGTVVAASVRADDAVEMRTVNEPPPALAAGPYVSSRQPLAPSALIKLPIGAIVPRGWLRRQLELEADGMSGHLEEISPWCRFETSGWSSPAATGHAGWEELPYWLKGYGDLGYVLKNERIIAHARKWIEAALAGQMDDGWFGPRALRTSAAGKPDLWPNMLMLNVLQSYYEYSGDARVLPFMTKYFRWELNCPDKEFLTDYWGRLRAGDNLESVYWLYNRTGEPWLLDLATKIHKHTADWTTGIHNWHGVNISQGFREPTIYFLQGKNQGLADGAEANYQRVMGVYGQVPGGGFGADENCRPGYTDPRQGFETCSIVEFMHSFEMLSRITGKSAWADRCEELAFNTLPAALTPDERALHYLTGPNMIQLDKKNKSPDLQNGGNMLSYSPREVYRCCQHNVANGWPYYAEELWLATGDNGLCASLYAACEVTAKVGDGKSGGDQVKIIETTDYPFEGTIHLAMATAHPVRFPLYLRIPKWCDKPTVQINGKAATVTAGAGRYGVVERTWSDGDRVTLELPMHVAVRVWEKNSHSVSVDYGPLTFALKIGQKWVRSGGTDAWPDFEVFPTTPWNYALMMDEKRPGESFEVVRKSGPLPEQPFEPDAAPIALQAKARRLPDWKQDKLGVVGKLQSSPAWTDQPVETVTLIPMGSARLRIAAFPVAGDGADAHHWTETKK